MYHKKYINCYITCIYDSYKKDKKLIKMLCFSSFLTYFREVKTLLNHPLKYDYDATINEPFWRPLDHSWQRQSFKRTTPRRPVDGQSSEKLCEGNNPEPFHGFHLRCQTGLDGVLQGVA